MSTELITSASMLMSAVLAMSALHVPPEIVAAVGQEQIEIPPELQKAMKVERSVLKQRAEKERAIKQLKLPAQGRA